MSEINYSKKQIEPLVLKFQINTKTNDVFKSIIALFDGQTNYQVWAIKLVFSGICTYETIARIKEWADTHQTEIKHFNDTYYGLSCLAVFEKLSYDRAVGADFERAFVIRHLCLLDPRLTI